MGVKVVKFGGSSVADADQIRKVKAILDTDSSRRFVVVSAPGKRSSDDVKVTDMLYACRESAASGKDFSDVFSLIEKRYRDIEKDLGTDACLEPEFDEIRRALTAGCTADYTASRGEHLNAVLIAAFLGATYIETAGKVLFDGDGELLADETDRALRAALPEDGLAVIPGFYGSVKDTGEIRVFSRGGSDITGALVARAADAEVYENWTDVSGLLSADPKIVPDAVTVPELSYGELRALSFMGAGVLHEDAVFPVRISGIPVNIRNTNRPEDAGTMIVPSRTGSDGTVKGVSGKKGYAMLGLSLSQMNRAKGFAAGFLGFLDEKGFNCEHMLTGVDKIGAVVKSDLSSDEGEKAASEAAAAAGAENSFWLGDIALISAAGEGLSRKPGSGAAFLSALYEAGIPVIFTDFGCDPDVLIAGVSGNDYEAAIRALHRAFIR